MPPTPPLYGLIGYPLEITLSPVLHQAALRWANLPGHYHALPVAPERLAEAIAGLRAWQLSGLNVTVPHKTAVIPLVDDLTSQAREIGAINTLYWEDGRLWGDNTDYAGFKQTLEGLALGDRPAVVLGAGGAARAVVAALRDLGLRPLHVLARRPEAGAALLDDLVPPAARGRAASFAEAPTLCRGAALVVQATSAPECPIASEAFAALAPGALLYDLRYHPAETPFLTEGRRHGLAGRNGLEMLLGQAAFAFERWTGRRPPLDVLREALTETRSACSAS